MSTLESSQVVTPSTKERVAYLDNARYWVMLLVVIGHSLTQWTDMDSARAIYVWIYSFHMPFFILISGYTARKFVGDTRQIQRTITTLLVPYLLVETSLQLITRHYSGEPDPLRILSPQWLAWFMAALVVWRLTTPIWRALKYPIATSIAISLVVGLFEIPNVLALPKILGFLPFYVVGLHMTRDRFLALTQTKYRIAAAILLVSSFIVCYFFSKNWTIDWLFWRSRYDEDPLSASPLEGMTQRAELLVIGFALTFAALSLVPKTKSWTTTLGTRTFYAYLLHGYIIIMLREKFDLFGDTSQYGVVAVVVAIVLATIAANLLMTGIVKKVFQPIFEPKMTWFFKPVPPSTHKSS